MLPTAPRRWPPASRWHCRRDTTHQQTPNSEGSLTSTLADGAPSLLHAPEQHPAAQSSGHGGSLHPPGRRLLLERTAGGSSGAALAVDPTPEATLVADAFHPHAEQLVAGLAAAGLRLTPDAAQRQAAVASIVAAAKALAAEAVSDTRSEMAALAAELRFALPKNAGPAGQSLHRGAC